jgi:uncharacterized protein (TIGR02186 family)
MRAGLRIAPLVIVASLVAGRTAAEEPVVADLSSHLVAVTTGFTGADLLLFGAIEEPGDIAVVVRGPNESIVVREKQRIAGVWINGANLTFADVPGFYAVATTKGLLERSPAALLKRQQIGVANLELRPDEPVPEAYAEPFRSGLVRGMERERRFVASPGEISVLGNRLFRTTVRFPSNVPTGPYMVEVYFIRDGEIVSAQTTPLTVSKLGLGAEVFDFAHRHSTVYGIIAVLVAVLSGWLAGLIFRKV